MDRLTTFIKDELKLKDEKTKLKTLSPPELKEKITTQAIRCFMILECLCVVNFRALPHLPSSSISQIIVGKKMNRLPFILKNAWIRAYLSSMKRGRSLGWIEVDRFKAKSLARKGLVDSYGHFTLFA